MAIGDVAGRNPEYLDEEYGERECEDDADEYQKKMREERRKSLANRNKESCRHAEVMKELRALTIEKEAESFMLKFAAENDAKEYLKKLADERRESLKLRGQEARKQREYEEERAKEAIDAALKEGKLQSECKSILYIDHPYSWSRHSHAI